MKFATKIAFALAVLTLVGASAVSAQQPFVACYFDVGLQQEQALCPGLGTLDTLYVAALNFNSFLAGIEYSVSYPPSLSYISDFNTPGNPGTRLSIGVTIGSSPSGIAIGYSIPQNGFFPVRTHEVLVQWQCNDCSGGQEQVVVSGHPLFAPNPRATRFPDNVFLNGVGLTALICATVPVEETTWGGIKSLYGE